METPAAVARVVEQEWGQRAGRLVGRLGREAPAGSATCWPPACWAPGPGEVLVGDSTSVDLYKLLVAGADARPGRDVLVCCADDFPTDRYIVAGVAAARGMTVREVDAHIDAGWTWRRWPRRWTSGSPSSSCPRSPTAPARWPTSPR